jgi:hypothetical protein
MATEQQFNCPECGTSVTVEGPATGRTATCGKCGWSVVVPLTVEAEASPTSAEIEQAGRETWNIVTDTVAGPNVRARDNLYQALVIGVCLLIGAVVGAVIALIYLADPQNEFGVAGRAGIGATLGGLLGLIVGVIGSGGFLAVYRLIRHVRGYHD